MDSTEKGKLRISCSPSLASAFAILTEMILQAICQIFFRHFQFHTVHGGVGLYGRRIEGLLVSAYHAFFDAHLKHVCKDLLEHLFRKKLACTAEGGMSGQFIFNVITNKEQDVQSRTTMLMSLLSLMMFSRPSCRSGI